MVTTWMEQHLRAILSPQGFEVPIVGLINSLKTYMLEHESCYGSFIAEDYVLGPQFLKAAKAVRELLNGETGRLDCGEMDSTIRRMLYAAGFSEDEVDNY
jgi:hypothetical protein